MESGRVNVRYEEKFIRNSRGMKLFTCRWMPAHSDAKGLVFLCHGLRMECSISMKGYGIRLAKAGYAVYGIDYEGHGKSSGLRCYIPNFDDLVNDCSDYFTSISERQENKNKKKILMGESMGGAVVLFLHGKKPDYWDMAVLVAPMCKIIDGMTPHPLVFNFLSKLRRAFPTWKIPTPNIFDVAVRVPEKRDEIISNPLIYKGWIRLATGYQTFKVCWELETRLEEVSLPFLVVHGGQDRVTDPYVSKLLYETARSSDKTFQLYPDMWHALTYGELPENVDIVFRDIMSWLDERVVPTKVFHEGESSSIKS